MLTDLDVVGVLCVVGAHTGRQLDTWIKLHRLQEAAENAICEIHFQFLRHGVVGAQLATDLVLDELQPQDL